MKIDVQDLLSLGFEEGQSDASTGKVDCLGAVACVFDKLGWKKGHLEPSGLDFGTQQITNSAWERIGREACNAKRIGDLILNTGKDNKPHVSVLVNENLGLALSAFEGHGAMVVSRSKIARVRGVYRLKEEYR